MIIPNRFEAIISTDYFNDFQPLLIPVKNDLIKIQLIKKKCEIQNGGILSFFLGTTGIGKTTLAYSIPTFLKDDFDDLLRIPDEINYRDVVIWINENLPEKSDKSKILLFDGREETDDKTGLAQFLSGLNQILRKRKDIIFIWPTNNQDWQKEVKEKAKQIGGSNFSPINADVKLTGLDKDTWDTALEKILIQLDLAIEDFALSKENLLELINQENTIGEFLSAVGSLLSSNVTELKEIKGLPHVVFVVSSGEEVVGESNRIRKVKTLALRAQELLSYSRKSESGKFWQERGKNPQESLAYIISLFDARLTTVGPSVLAYSALHYGNDVLKKIVEDSNVQPHITNAKTTFKASDLYKYLTNTTPNELTSSKKGKTGTTTMNAFEEIQKLSATTHKEINKSIAGLMENTLELYDKEKENFEVNAGEQNLYTDMICSVDSQEFYLEFHHLSINNCKAASMASYIMGKLRAYAFHYNLIKR